MNNQLVRIALRSVVVASIGLAATAKADCVPTIKFGEYNNLTQLCTDSGTFRSEVALLTQIALLRAQNAQLKTLIDSMNALVAANTAFRDTFQQVVTDRQVKMRDEVVSQLGAMPSRVASDPAVVASIASAVSAQLTTDEDFLRRVHEKAK